MRRLMLVAVLATALLVAFAGSALADGPYGSTMGYGSNQYGGYGMSYGGYGGYGGYNMNYGNYGGYSYGGYKMHYGGYKKGYHPNYNPCCTYVYKPCPKAQYGYKQNYGYGGYNTNYWGYGMMNYGSYAGYGY